MICVRCRLPIVLRNSEEARLSPENGEGLVINTQVLVAADGRTEVIEQKAWHEVCPA